VCSSPLIQAHPRSRGYHHGAEGEFCDPHNLQQRYAMVLTHRSELFPAAHLRKWKATVRSPTA